MNSKVSMKVDAKLTDISKKDLIRAEKVALVKMVHNGEYTEFMPATIVDRELKEWTSRMDRGLKLKGHLFETGYLPLNVFIFEVDYSDLRKEK
jgi:hypothetical protein